MMGSEDFSYYCSSVPGWYFLLGLKAADGSSHAAVHSPQFDFNDQAIPTGVKVLAVSALLA